MSYDIYLFKKLDDKSVEESADIVLADDKIHALAQGDFELIAQEIVKKLKELNARFEEFHSESNVELSDPETGIQISIFKNQIAVTMPYWHEDDEQPLHELFSYIAVMRKVTGYAAFDPQIGKEINDADSGVVGDSYGTGVAQLKSVVASSNESKNKSVFWYQVALFIICALFSVVGIVLHKEVMIVGAPLFFLCVKTILQTKTSRN
jgi:hypothetical protein